LRQDQNVAFQVQGEDRDEEGQGTKASEEPSEEVEEGDEATQEA
jgi:hypothetical protein